MAKKDVPADLPPVLTVYPEPSLPEGSFVAGVPVNGIELTADEARPLLEAGTIVTTPPPGTPAHEPEG